MHLNPIVALYRWKIALLRRKTTLSLRYEWEYFDGVPVRYRAPKTRCFHYFRLRASLMERTQGTPKRAKAGHGSFAAYFNCQKGRRGEVVTASSNGHGVTTPHSI
ncbi:hypothetical protein ZHAS_00013836 [Anopheles sinensis]|uniref:Uncharacterized protein n=1 Tax=Anopheles sinensis TaxID=74873 RepID=A0A084W6N2_ANOSI|nr:hypothetical protein ZHAS_00013836 [Anopheles sinensis]